MSPNAFLDSGIVFLTKVDAIEYPAFERDFFRAPPTLPTPNMVIDGLII